MKKLVVTNNDGDLRTDLQGLGHIFDVVYIDGTIKDVAIAARDYLLGEYQLAADPLAGRRERATPYLSIVLQPKKEQGVTLEQEVLRIERFIEMYYVHQEFLGKMEDEEKRDYRLIDRTLTLSCCQKMTSWS